MDEVFLVYDAVRRDPRGRVARQAGRHRRENTDQLAVTDPQPGEGS